MIVLLYKSMAEKSESRLYLGMKEKDSRERGRQIGDGSLITANFVFLLDTEGGKPSRAYTVVKSPRVCARSVLLADIRPSQTPARRPKKIGTSLTVLLVWSYLRTNVHPTFLNFLSCYPCCLQYRPLSLCC
jgi:hypothetical protein